MSLPEKTPEYQNWLGQLKSKVRQVQLKAAVSVNRELLQFYWELGTEILQKQGQSIWGDGFLKQLSVDLISEFPEIRGFSYRNMKYIRHWRNYYSGGIPIGQQAVAQFKKLKTETVLEPILPTNQSVSNAMQSILQSIPWGHQLVLISKCPTPTEAFYYANQTLENNWSRSVLTHQIESGLYKREGKAVTNFSVTLPKPQSDLAQQIIKDPYNFDFLTLTKAHNERDLERALIEHITHFLLELGAGFAYLGKQIPLQVGERDFFLDLLFYHTRLHCYVVVELKTTDFEPEHAGKLNFYIKAVDTKYRQAHDEPTIGILLCKGKDKMVAEYALSDINKPIGVSEYQLTQSLPDNLKPSLPSIEEIEAELSFKINESAEMSA